MKKKIFFVITTTLFYLLGHSQKVGHATGSGIALTKNGHIATNYHVVDGALKIEVDVNYNGTWKTFNASVVKSDIENDLSILRITDPNFKGFDAPPFALKMSVSVGEKAFAMGYPQINSQGKEVKVTDGIISSKTGFQNSNRDYQTSVPIQSGNSGGPLFDYNGNLIGINNAKITSAENVSYAIKISYLNNLIDQLTDFPGLPENNKLSNLPLISKVKILSPFVVLIRVLVPECDKDIPSELVKKINSSFTLSDVNDLFGIKGEKNSETQNHLVYKWQFCGDDLLNSILVSFINNKVYSIVKSFSNTLFSDAKEEYIDDNLKSNVNYDQVCKMFGNIGDLKTITFNGSNTSIVIEWKLKNNQCYWVTFFKGLVLSLTKNKCLGTN